ncbi:hypothetical protein V1517DRAFT_318605 [Lipomyces orientalis]|uniref:Uncharacterized protein n=1 Tax=Lipomyces orientalis TaxID=1233043 RepID=A0ACC3TS96_9ASCO
MADISEKFDGMSIKDQGGEQSWSGEQRRTYVPPHARKFGDLAASKYSNGYVIYLIGSLCLYGVRSQKLWSRGWV